MFKKIAKRCVAFLGVIVLSFGMVGCKDTPEVDYDVWTTYSTTKVIRDVEIDGVNYNNNYVKMEKAIKDLFRVITAPLRVSTGKNVDVINLDCVFTRNIPNNITEIVDTVTKLDGKVDKETLLGLLPFIDNPSETLKKLEEDIQRDKASMDPYSIQNIQADENNLFPNLNSPQEQLNAMRATIPQP